MMVQAVGVGPAPAAPSGDWQAEEMDEEVGLLSFDLDQVTSALGTFAEGVTSALRRAQPDRLTVEFGCQVGVETSGLIALITKGSVDANLTVTMEWDRSVADPRQPDEPRGTTG
ncbi:CU044_2847 family protein [Streptomyces sp. NPDC051018]|uniref:CU044_2847 family protein n=1 Tax=Streptomyces sp. NPDC051018 TaxID=3365639 RepID=UPI00378CCF97